MKICLPQVKKLRNWLIFSFITITSGFISHAQVQIGIAKQVGVANFTGSGIYEVPYTITLKNLGTATATNVQVVENLVSTFPLPASVLSVFNLSATSPLTINPAFDGKNNLNLLTGNNNLPVGSTAYIVKFIVRVNITGSGSTIFNNNATATTAVSSGGAATSTDVSNNGTDPDPNNNKNPNEGGESQATSVTLATVGSFFCKGMSGPNLIPEGDFGTGGGNVGPALVAGTTTYVYDAVDLGFPEGKYSIVKNVKPLKPDWIITSDHTGNGGYYMAINGAPTAGTFFEKTISGLCTNTTYEFSVWIVNQQTPGYGLSLPQIAFQLNGATAFSPTPVPENGQWTKQGFVFNTGNTSTFKVSIINVNTAASGNDLGIDDISLTACLPVPVVTPSTLLPVCTGQDIVLSAKIPDFNTSYSTWNYYVWERSTDNGNNWAVISGPTQGEPPININLGTATAVMNGYKYRLKVATTAANLTSSGCFAVSQPVGLQVGQVSTYSTSVTSPTCSLNDGKISLTGLTTSDSVSIDGSAFAKGSFTVNFSGLASGPHTISVRKFPCQKDTLIVLNPPINCGPSMGTAKRVSSPVQQPDGSYNVLYTISVKNYGQVPLTNVQITENLNTVFGAPATFSLIGNTISSGTLIANPTFTGNSDINLLAAGSTLGVGISATVIFKVNIKPNGNFGPFSNNVTGSASGPSGTTTSVSNDGDDPDSNNNGIPNEASERNPTILKLVANPILGVAKLSSFPLYIDDNSYDVTYTITLKNYGNVDLSNVQVTEDLAAAFPSPLTYTIKNAPVATGGLVVNSSFNGLSNKNLLSAGSILPVFGTTQTITFSINIELNGASGNYSNSVTGSATGPGGVGNTSDVSTDGIDPDPNNNGNPSDPGENKTTTIVLPIKPVIGLAKKASSPALQTNGSYNITYTLTVENIGSENLNNIRLIDNLAIVFPSPATFSIINSPVATGSLVSNPAYNGNSVADLLKFSSLSAGERASVQFTVNVIPNGSFGPFENSALVSGVGASDGITVKDLSNNGTEVDPNNNNNASDNGSEDVVTQVSLTPNPVIAIAKSATVPALQGNGSYNITYTLNVQNLGNVALTNVQVTDNLKSTFPSPVSASIVGSPIASSGLTINPSFNGNSDINLLSTGNILTLGSTQTITFTINVIANGSFGPFSNFASATGTGFGGINVSDISNSGNDPDPNHDGNPSNGGSEDAATVIKLNPNPIIGIAEMAGTPLLQADGSYNITVSIIIENLGNVALNNVQIKNDLSNTFPTPTIFKVITAPSGAVLTGNPGYEGASSTNLLSGSNTLAIGEKKTLTFVVNVFPNGSFGPFNNSSIATAVGAGGTGNTSDISDDGVVTDPNNNGNPNEKEENDPSPIVLIPVPVIGVAKSVSNTTVQGNGSYNVTYSIVVKNLGNTNLKDVQVNDDLTEVFRNPSTFSMVGNPTVTGSTLALNTGFNGSSNTNLLLAGSTLPIGSQETITFTVNILPNGNFGPFSNSAVGSGADVNGRGNTNDISTTGTNPDPDGNGNPNDENEPTILVLPPSPVLGVAKTVTNVSIQPDGSYSMDFVITVKNLGNVDLVDVKVTDDMIAAFPNPVVFSFIGNPVATGTLKANNSFNGITVKDLLLSGSSLGISKTETITFKINLNPKTDPGPFSNSAAGSASNIINGITVTDISANGINPDPNGNGNPKDAGEDTATPISLPVPNPLISIKKTAGTAIYQAGTSSYNVTYTLVIKNAGNVSLTNVQASDNLSTTFPSPTTFSIVANSLSATNGLIVLPTFDGKTNTNLFTSSGNNLNVGDSSVVIFTVNFLPNGNAGPFNNVATGTATGSGNTGITSVSSNPASLSLPPSPVLGVAKSVSNPVANVVDGSHSVIYTITIKNFGNDGLTNIQVTDNLLTTFPSPATFSVTDITGSGVTPNPTFDGKNDINLLSSGTTLAINSSATVSFKVTIIGSGEFKNSAFGSAVGASNSAPTTDISTSGTNPDPNNNGKPDDKDEDLTTSVTIGNVSIQIPEGFSPNGDAVNDVFAITGVSQGITIYMEVYNRWGNLVYKNGNYKNEWDGKCNHGIYFGSNLPDGTYYYVINLSNGEKFVRYLTINR